MLFSFLWKESYAYLLVVLVAIMFYALEHSLQTYRNEVEDITTHTADLSYARGNISYNGAFFLISSLQNTLPPEERLKPIPSTRMNLGSDFYNKLPPFYSDYLNRLTVRMHEDLCSDPSPSINSIYKNVNCSNLCSRRLRLGFPESFIMFNDLTRSFYFTPMEEFNVTYNIDNGVKAQYPVFVEVLYSRKILFDLIGETQTEFSQLTEQYIAIQNQRLT